MRKNNPQNGGSSYTPSELRGAHALEKEMATHSSVLAWRIPWTVEPGGLPSVGLHRVRHDWSDLAAAAALQEEELLWTSLQPLSPRWIKNGLIFVSERDWGMDKQWSDQEEGGCVQLGLLFPFSQNFQQQKEKRPDFNLASICLKRFCLLCALWAKSHSRWKIANSTQQTIPHHPGPRLFFSYQTRCISLLFSPPRSLSTCPPAPNRKEAGWQSLTFFWFLRFPYSRYPPYTSYVCYTEKKQLCQRSETPHY